MLVETAQNTVNAAQIKQEQIDFFRSGKTLDVSFRIDQLKRLEKAILANQEEILKALKSDLNKSDFEAFGTEIGIILVEIKQAIKQVRKWAAPKKVGTALFHFKASSKIYSDPYGSVLIIAPWNYPFQLLMAPLVGSIAAGNCSIVKPSELAPATSAVVAKLLSSTFSEEYIAVVEGGVQTAQELLKIKHDFVFFTGSTAVGKIVYKAAAEHLTPVILELGGKSPTIVDEDTNIDLTAKRIAWGKLLNAGQTCIAPDYLLVNEKVKTPLIDKLKEKIKELYGEDASESDDYGRIINQGHFDRLENLMDADKIVFGGKTDRADRFIEPTLIDDVEADDKVMQEEIFGPLLPILTYSKLDEAIQFVNDRPKPLALYFFSRNRRLAEKVLSETSSGGACVNDTMMHIANENLSFGGVGDSGIGGYHGKHSFDAFSHQKGVMNKSFLLDPPIRYAPYDKVSIPTLKKLFDNFL